mmetsp:Transcript_26917/g.80693  ORF Transcript_26917/g.80693 Transcript_26917/m.80693 type:complete len:321 (+) Transcript_26917:297-1259(+)|eukprot:CAMPEP_0119271142 /NCGR_PEP_ID=MMETSP1329-20130426/7856_1 /TAXON_ID=114041 /ORGANISM="Genus nov. species nov., Strain RCC1024" /LENGTH=320 /DNA_ID=CAMNT_0007271183 /DNA_START=211 /DNA_END=1173 /DNA_ORIENTATION=-
MYSLSLLLLGSARALSLSPGRAQAVEFHGRLLDGAVSAQDAVAMLERMEAGAEKATPDVVTYSLVAAQCLDEAVDADALLARGAKASKRQAPYLRPPKRRDVQRFASTLDVLHEDDAIIAVAKPSGVLSHREKGAAGVALPHVVEFAKPNIELSKLGGPHARGIVHRLDRDVSGCMVLAKTDAAHALLVRAFLRREATKTYVAVGRVDGASIAPGEEVEATEPVQGKPASTLIECTALAGGYALLSCRTQTGRRHQVRRHCASLGLPLAGDGRFGGQKEAAPGVLLHASALAVPAVGLDVSCPPPAWWGTLGFVPPLFGL